MNAERALRWALLALLVLTGFHFRARLSAGSPRFDPADDAAYFRAESATQYRLARLYAREGGVPDLDRAAQWPEGVRPKRELTTLMERTAALAWRALPEDSRPEDFRWFLILFSSFAASLSVPALYLLGLRLTKDPWLSLAATAAYGLSWASMANAAGTFRLESFAWPLIHWGLACLAAILDPDEQRPYAWGIAAMSFFALSLASWHFARFVFVCVALACAYAYWRNKDAVGRGRLKQAAAWLLAGGVLGILISGSLRESLFVLSPDSYSHVYGLFWAKLRFFLVKPADPSLLSPEQRIEWTGPSNSPEAGFALFTLFPLALVLIPRIYSRFRGEKEAVVPLRTLANALALTQGMGAVLVSRLLPPFSFFLVLSALAFSPAKPLRPKVLAAFALVAFLELFKALAPGSALNPFLRLAAAFDRPSARPSLSLEAERDLLDWLKARGGPDAPVLANIGLSGTILAYAKTPVLLQPKFEARGIRDKTAEFLKALYSDETAFHAFCEKYGAKFFVYTTDYLLDETLDGPAYMAGAKSLDKTSPVHLFHFQPEALTRFRLVHQNNDLRIYAVEPAGKLTAVKPPHPAVYRMEAYTLREEEGGAVRLDIAATLKRMEEGRVHFLLARLLTQVRRHEEALAAYEASFLSWPPEPAMVAERDRLAKAVKRAKN